MDIIHAIIIATAKLLPGALARAASTHYQRRQDRRRNRRLVNIGVASAVATLALLAVMPRG